MDGSIRTFSWHVQVGEVAGESIAPFPLTPLHSFKVFSTNKYLWNRPLFQNVLRCGSECTMLP